MGSVSQITRTIMLLSFIVVFLVIGCQSKLMFGPVAEANHRADFSSGSGCDPDYGWLDGVDGSGKCYMLIKGDDFSSCYTERGAATGMSWFEGFECCSYHKGYLAEPANEEEQAKLEEYIQIADGGTLGLSAWWLGGNDMHQEYKWMDLNCTDSIHGAVTHYA